MLHFKQVLNFKNTKLLLTMALSQPACKTFLMPETSRATGTAQPPFWPWFCTSQSAVNRKNSRCALDC